MTSSVVRKISIGSDYKNEAMHYSLGQTVYGGHEICDIILDQKDSSYNIYIKKIKRCCLERNLILTWQYLLNII
tara:strand:- start:1517 stop:1738 length:222 start_codon:yes stop_codon:yes gene_type:complete